MTAGTRNGAAAVAVALALVSGSIDAFQPERSSTGRLADIDVREWRAPAQPSASAAAEVRRAADRGGARGARLHPHTGAVRVLDMPGVSLPPQRGAARGALMALAPRLGLTAGDLVSLAEVREYFSASTGLRHVTFAQYADGIPVFDAAVSVHVRADGQIVRITSGAARLTGRRADVTIAPEHAAGLAVGDVRPGLPFSPVSVGGAGGPARGTLFARGPLNRDVETSLTWLPMDGGVRLAWRVAVEPEASTESYDLLFDAQTGERLLRRNRVRYAEGAGRVLQSAAMQAIDLRRPDAAPQGTGGCPPVVNYALRSLTAPFRDPSTLLFDTGQLAGNNARVYRRTDGAAAATGTFDGIGWTFDFPFNSAGSAETALFFALNYAHDFFYDLGFDEGAGNYQVDNFGRGGVGGDSVKGLARASGRNNATFMPAPDGTSPTISMFLFDGTGCWGADTDGDGSLDLDGDYDFDIIIHEFAHGVSLRLNTAFEGAEADAMGEGFSDFFSYSITGETTLAEYALPGGLRGINSKTYSDWTCLFGFWCEEHANGEIWVNAVWDVRERFRRDLVRGSEPAAVDESHQLAVDALKLSPPAPTMLDMRDAVLLADALRNPGPAGSMNFCRIWEPFAARGMGLNATDTVDNGFNEVGADHSVPAACQAPPPPPTVTVTVASATATEAGPTNGRFVISRGVAADVPLVVGYFVGGTAVHGVDYLSISSSATIPGGAADVSINIVPVDDQLLEANETVVLTLAAAGSYVPGSPSSGTVMLVSDDVAADLALTAFTAPQTSGSGMTIQVADTTKNQGSGPSAVSETSFYLSQNLFFDANDVLLGGRTVPELQVGGSHAATTSLVLPSPLAPGPYTLFARADGPGAIVEMQESNNLRYTSIRVGPDLTVTAATALAVGGAGLSITVSDTTTNGGGGTAGASTTRVYLSTNYSWDAADVPLQGRSVPALAPGAVSSGSTLVTIPTGTATGTYYLIARADGLENVPESSETNNTRSTIMRVGPDLVVSALSGPAAAGPGTAIAVSETTTNSGGGAAGASSTRFYLSTNYLLDGGDIAFDARSVPPLASGAGHAATTTVTMPSALAPGLYYLIARADAADALPETSDSNNTRYILLNVGPDLIVSAVSVPSRSSAGATITLTDTTKNIGAGAAAASSTAWYLSTNVSLDAADVRLAPPHAVAPLNPGASAVASVAVTVPAVAPGTWFLLAVADDAKVVTETLEGNNLRYAALLIGPDLYIAAASVPSTFASGSTVSVFEMVANQGAPAGPSRTRFYLSRNNALDVGDILLDQFRDVPALAQGASSNGTTVLSSPAGLSGTYYVLIVADGGAVVSEANEANNVAPRAVQITP
jgi:subtilase family serine protease